MIHDGAVNKRNDKTCSSEWRDYGNKRIRQRQGVEVQEVGTREEQAYERNGPAPRELILLSVRPPDEKQQTNQTK